jgi:hypothetical protein
MRQIVEPDNCKAGKKCTQFLCQGIIQQCNNNLGIYYKDWNDLLRLEKKILIVMNFLIKMFKL